jgi:hypothetical protein
MLALESPRWSDLEHAYGSAVDVPELIRAIASEPRPRCANPSPWETVYTALVHQYTTYSATYAAFPHIVEIAENDGVDKQAETLILAALIRVQCGPAPQTAYEFLPEFETAVDKVRRLSLDTVRGANLEDPATLPHLLQAFAGLRHPTSILVEVMDNFGDGDWEFEIHCPSCPDFFAIEMTADGPVSQPWYGSDLPIKENTRKLPVDRSDYPMRLESGRKLLQQSSDPDWPESQTANVLAALARERNARDLATRILDTAATIACPLCNASIDLGKELHS